MGPQLREVATMMQKPFPELTHLILLWKDARPPALPKGFLGGSAPRLQHMHLQGIPFPALPSLLSSARDLVDLYLDLIPRGGYISPEAMVPCLAVLPRLKSLSIGAEFTSHADRNSHQIRPPPVTRTLLPALTSFQFRGTSRYLEGLISQIDSPQLNQICICDFHWLFDFQVAQLFKFIDRSEDVKLTLIRHADVIFSDYSVTFEMYQCPQGRQNGPVSTSILCEGISGQVLFMAQVFSQPSAILSRVAHLKLSQDLDVDGHHAGWLHLFCQFFSVQTLHIAHELAGHVALALEEVTGEMVSEVLPALDLIFLVGQPVSSIDEFIAARRLSGHPVTIVDTEMEFDKRLKSYVSE